MSTSVDDLVAAFHAGEHTMFDACTDAPNFAWAAILELSRSSLTEDDIGLLAAGPMETLLSWHGEDFIAKVEKEAKTNRQFASMLGGVWQNNMSDEVWQRLQQVWDRSGWDDNPGRLTTGCS